MHDLTCNLCRLDMASADSCVHWHPADERLTHHGTERCKDCHVLPGGTHHPHCDFFVCLTCGGYEKDCGCGEEAGSADE